MMYLHEDRELFLDVLTATAEDQQRPIPIVEKDYYVTLILKELAEKESGCVFKGGTSLSKCYHVIDRFSEDIDIAFSNELTQGQRKKLKNETIAEISGELGLPISNWETTRSRRDYNCYVFDYLPAEGHVSMNLIPGIKMEVTLGSVSFPVVRRRVDSYVYEYLAKENMDVAEKYGLVPFEMSLQSLERTFVDKVFAICDYYISGEIKRHSRHIYDLHKLIDKVDMNADLKKLVGEVRACRAEMAVCPSAKDGVNIPTLLEEIAEKRIYESDYVEITTYFQKHPVDYEEIIKTVKVIAESGIF